MNPLTRIADLISARITGYPRVVASHACDNCDAQKGMRHRLAGCEGNERDVRRRLLADYPGEEISDTEVDRRYAEALEAHRRNAEDQEKP